MPIRSFQKKNTSTTSSIGVTRSSATSAGASDTEDKSTSTGQQFELLQYDWPDLPPIAKMKDAVCRQSVSRGISYLLPVDKGRNSIGDKFRTDLRAMFLEPYILDDHQYNDGTIGPSSRVHFLTNRADVRWTLEHARSVPIRINAASETVRKIYSRSAPVNGPRQGLGHGLAPKSVYLLPLRTHVKKGELSPDLAKLKEEADIFIKRAVLESDGSPVDKGEGHESTDATAGQITAPLDNKLPVQTKVSLNAGGQPGNLSFKTKDTGQRNVSEPSVSQSYEDFIKTLSAKCQKNRIPENLRSPYLQDDRSQEIWDWLHHGHSMGEFDCFMSLCG